MTNLNASNVGYSNRHGKPNDMMPARASFEVRQVDEDGYDRRPAPAQSYAKPAMDYSANQGYGRNNAR